MNANNIKVLVYPYDSNFAPILTLKEVMLKNLDIVGVISPIGWGLCNKPAVTFTENSHDDLIIQSGVERFNSESYDALFIVDSDKDIDDKTLIEQISLAAKEGKGITISRSLSDDARNTITEICFKNNVVLDMNEYQTFEKNYAYGDRLFDIHVPIISVSGIGENCDKFDVQIELRKRLIQQGYKVCSVSSHYELAKDFEVFPFPRFMRSDSISESDKIITYNHYIHQLEQQEEPDVFIIGIPGGIMPITRSKTAHFGINSFEVYNAVNPDFTIVNLHCGDCSLEYLTEINKIFKYKFNVELDCFFISNYLYDSSTLNGNRSTRYLIKDNVAVSKQVEAMSNYDYKIFCKTTYDKMYEYIIDKLGSYDELKIL